MIKPEGPGLGGLCAAISTTLRATMTHPMSNRIKFIGAYTDQSRRPGDKLRQCTCHSQWELDTSDRGDKNCPKRDGDRSVMPGRVVNEIDGFFVHRLVLIGFNDFDAGPAQVKSKEKAKRAIDHKITKFGSLRSTVSQVTMRVREPASAHEGTHL